MIKRFANYAFVTVATLMVSSLALAQEHADGAADTVMNFGDGRFFAAAFAIAVAAFGGALGQGKGLSAACEAMGRNPGGAGAIRVTMIIGLALVESLVIYALVVAIMILNA
jgi:F-type H+-transporting ATPase subunit c